MYIFLRKCRAVDRSWPPELFGSTANSSRAPGEEREEELRSSDSRVAKPLSKRGPSELFPYEKIGFGEGMWRCPYEKSGFGEGMRRFHNEKIGFGEGMGRFPYEQIGFGEGMGRFPYEKIRT